MYIMGWTCASYDQHEIRTFTSIISITTDASTRTQQRRRTVQDKTYFRLFIVRLFQKLHIILHHPWRDNKAKNTKLQIDRVRSVCGSDPQTYKYSIYRSVVRSAIGTWTWTWWIMGWKSRAC